MKREERLEQLKDEVLSCSRCELCKEIKNKVFGQGDPLTNLVIVGEAPGNNEDIQGVPFCGDSGKLLVKFLIAIGLERKDVYICNVLKCRPPANRDPLSEEVEKCSGYLKQQLEIIQPSVILTCGKFPSQVLLNTMTPISKLRNSTYKYKADWNCTLIPTYHPSYLLRQPSARLDAWKDWQKVRAILRGEHD